MNDQSPSTIPTQALTNDLLALGPALVPRLLDLLVAGERGSASVHAVGLLIDLRATDAIVPLLRVYTDELGMLDEAESDEARSVRIMVRLPEFGRAALEPALAFVAEHVEEDDAVYAAASVLVRLGIRDDRIFDAIQRVFDVEAILGAGMFADYGDERGIAVIEGALDRFEPDFSWEWSRICVADLLHAHERLGGVVGPALRERVDGWFREWDAHGVTDFLVSCGPRSARGTS